MTTKRGCLLVALGTPARPDPDAIREFLRTFLSDPAVVDFPKWLWKPILENIVLRFRPAKIAPIYQKIWTECGSPLEVYTKAQCDLVARALPDYEVKYAMTYTKPDIFTALSEFTADEVAILPLYPHHVPSTISDIYRQVAVAEKKLGEMKLSIIPEWSENKNYIEWYREKLQKEIAIKQPEKIIFSYHGVPERKAHQPASYLKQCVQSTNAIMQGIEKIPYESTFQSKFGPGKWLQPATIDRMKALPSEGVKNVLVLTPGFVSDCIETIDELDVINQETFIAAGGAKYRRITPLNDAPQAGEILAALVSQHFTTKN